MTTTPTALPWSTGLLWATAEQYLRVESRGEPASTTYEVAVMLGVSPTTVCRMVNRGELIFFRSSQGRRRRFPHWQFTKDGQRTTVKAWVKPLLTAYGNNGIGLVHFMTVPRLPPINMSYLAKIELGETPLREVIEAARRTNRD